MIDASIPLQVQAPRIEDQGNALMRVLQMSQLMDERQKYQKTLTDENALNSAYSQALGPDGKLDRNRLFSVLAGANQGRNIPGIQKQLLEADDKQADIGKKTADAEEARTKAAKTRIDITGQASGWLRQNPTAENAMAVTQHLLSNGIISEDQARASLAKIQADPSPEAIARSADAAFRAALDAKDQLLKTETRNTGGTTDTLGIDPVTGQTRVLNTVQNTQSPDNKATNETSRANNAATVAATVRGQDLTDARSRESNAQGKTQIVETPNGFVIVDKNTGQSRPATAADGTPLKGKANDRVMTDSQAKANLFGTRMKESDRILNELDGKYSPAAVNFRSAAADVPVVGGITGYGANLAASPQTQQAEQAQRDFINAVLRRESGAAISANEFANAKQQYFPQPGDRPEVKAQKARNRALAISGMEAEVPGGFRTAPSLTSPGGAAAPVSPDVDALVKKYGGG